MCAPFERDGRILASARAKSWPAGTSNMHDCAFAENILMPGLVKGHSRGAAAPFCGSSTAAISSAPPQTSSSAMRQMGNAHRAMTERWIAGNASVRAC